MNECLFSKSQIREFEEYLFEHEIISNDKLKEKAAKSCEKIQSTLPTVGSPQFRRRP